MKKQLLGVFAAATALGTGFLSATGASAFDAGNIASATDLKDCLKNSGITCKLTDDVVLTSENMLDVLGTVTLDLNGKKITVSSDYQKQNIIVVHRGGNLTIKDATGEGLISGEGGAFSGGYQYPFSVVALTASADAGSDPAKITINGGTLSGNYYGIAGNGNAGRGNTEITINGGVVKNITENDGTGIYHPQYGVLNINGGEVSGAAGIYMKSGKLNMTGGTVKGIGAKTDYVPTKDGIYATGDAIVVDNCNYPGGAPSATISGGTINSKNAKAIGSYVGNGVEETELVEPTISGGNFSTEPNDEDIPEGYKKVRNADGTWTVSKIVAPQEEEEIPTAPESGFMAKEGSADSGMFLIAMASAVLLGATFGIKKLIKR